MCRYAQLFSLFLRKGIIKFIELIELIGMNSHNEDNGLINENNNLINENNQNNSIN